MNNDATVSAAAQALVQAATERSMTITTIESCTGGLIAGAITGVAGSSAVFETGFVTYANAAKTRLVGVLPQTLASVGAVSRSTVLQMAQGGLIAASADLAIAVSGIAGPGGGSAEKPVGLVHLALCTSTGRSHHEHTVFAGDRTAVRNATVIAALKRALELIEARD